MTVKDALGIDSLRSARLVAGARGLGRDVRWAHVIDIPDPLPWVRAGQLLLTTGYAWPAAETRQRAQIREFGERGLAAVALAVPRYLTEFSAAARDEADAGGLPLIEIPFEVPFAQITEELHRAILAEQYQIIERSEHIHRALTRAAAGGTNLDDLARVLGELIRRSVTFEDPAGKLLAYYTAGTRVDSVREQTLRSEQSPPATFEALEQRGLLREIRSAAGPLRIPAIPEIAMAARVVCPIRLGAELVGFVWIIEGEDPLSELDYRAAEHAALVAAVHIAHQRDLVQTEARLGYASLGSLLEAEDDDPRAVERARLLGFDPQSWHRVGIAVIPEPLPLAREGFMRRERIAEVLRSKLEVAGSKPLVTVNLNLVSFLLPDGLDAQALWRSLGDDGVSIALGRRYRGTAGARRSYREARSLLNYRDGSRVCRFEEALVPRVLMGDAGARDDFIKDMFGALRARKSGAVLEQALLTLAKSGFNFKRASQQLDVHLNTLRYRLARAVEILNVRLDDPETRFRLQLAARILDFTPKT